MRLLYSFILTAFFFNPLFSQDTQSIVRYEKNNNSVTFSLDNGAKVKLKFLDGENIKFWYSPDGLFHRSNNSFAVINEEFDKDYTIEVNESVSNYEIFTDQLRVVINKSPFKTQIFNKYQNQK